MKKYVCRYCPSCQRNVRAEHSGPNLGLHALLLVCSCGFYFPVWLFVMLRENYLCWRCGARIR